MSTALPLPIVTASQAAATATVLAGPLNPVTWVERPLYGGALTACLPSRFTDCSDFRQIPDHQEVWADADTDQSIIIELNSRDEDVPDAAAVAHYAAELAIANGALDTETLQTGLVSHEAMPAFAGVHKSFLVTSQRISKFKESEAQANSVQIYLAVVRLATVTTDLLISFNVPLHFGAGSSSEGRAIMDSDENRAVIEGVLKTLQVKDWGLFGSGDQ